MVNVKVLLDLEFMFYAPVSGFSPHRAEVLNPSRAAICSGGLEFLRMCDARADVLWSWEFFFTILNCNFHWYKSITKPEHVSAEVSGQTLYSCLGLSEVKEFTEHAICTNKLLPVLSFRLAYTKRFLDSTSPV
jgi:hypothetical protein